MPRDMFLLYLLRFKKIPLTLSAQQATGSGSGSCRRQDLGLYFVYILVEDWNLLTKLCSSDPNFNRNILTFLYLKSKTSGHAQI